MSFQALVWYKIYKLEWSLNGDLFVHQNQDWHSTTFYMYGFFADVKNRGELITY